VVIKEFASLLTLILILSVHSMMSSHPLDVVKCHHVVAMGSLIKCLHTKTVSKDKKESDKTKISKNVHTSTSTEALESPLKTFSNLMIPSTSLLSIEPL